MDRTLDCEGISDFGSHQAVFLPLCSYPCEEVSLHLSRQIQTDLLLASMEAPPYKGHLPSGAVQRRGTKYILNDFQSDYKSRLISLDLLPLMYTYEILDILFLAKSLKTPDPSLPIHDFISFSSSTRAGCTSELVHQESSTSTSSHSYFRRVTQLWNALPIIDLNSSLQTIKLRLKKYMWNRFIENFDPNVPCTFHFLCPCSKCTRIHHTPNFSPIW